MQKFTFVLLFAILIGACGQKTESKKKLKDFSAIKDSLTLRIEQTNGKGKIVGFSTAIVDTTGILYNQGFGFSNSKSKKEYSTETIQYVGSISKTLIGISLFKAQELGKLKIDEPINKYLPFRVVNPKFPEIPITIRQLAIHSSSIVDSDEFWENDYLLLQKEHPEGTGIPEYFNQPKTKISISKLLKELLTKSESFSTNEPNKKFNYSNVGSTLCALVIESATGMPYQMFTKKHILEPLEMDSSGWTIEEVNSKNRSILYATNEQIMADYTTIAFPSSGLITSSTDLGKFLTEIIRGYSGKGSVMNKKRITVNRNINYTVSLLMKNKQQLNQKIARF